MCRFTAVILLGLVALALAACGGGSDDSSSTPPTGRIAFASDRDGNTEIYVMNADGSGQVNVSNNPAGDDDPWWSPDGKQIGFKSSRGADQDLWTMNADGSNPTQVTRDPALDGQLRWSPDGKKIAYYSFAQQSEGYLWVADADGGDPQGVLKAIHPAQPDQDCAGGFPGGWYPDGQHILFRGSRGSASALQICSVKSDGSDLKVLYSQPSVQATFPALSPDASKIAFVTNQDGNEEIYVMDADGGNLQRVTDDKGKDLWPSWSPDGKWIAFSSDRDGDFEVYIMRPDGSGLKQLTSNTASDSNSDWAP
jgi:Tol biopolymer transport system component